MDAVMPHDWVSVYSSAAIAGVLSCAGILVFSVPGAFCHMSYSSESAGITESPKASTRLRQAIPILSESELRVAMWMLDNPGPATRQSMSAIAQLNDVSDTTVLRMCRTAGFKGFTDLKLELVREDRVTVPDPETPEQDADIHAARSVFAANLQAVSDTQAVLDGPTFIDAVDRLAGARHVLVGGVGGSGLVGQVLYQRCGRLGIRCEAPVDTQLQVMHAALLGPGDLAVAVSYSGSTRDMLLFLDEARRSGAATMCITGNTQSALARRSDTALVSVSYEMRSEPMAAQVAMITLVDALYAALVARDPDRAQQIEERMVTAIVPRTI